MIPPHHLIFPSLRPQSSPDDTRDEDHPESALLSLYIPQESDAVAFAASPAGRLGALEVLVPGSRVALPDNNGFSTLLELP